jgi:hypothetical protein
MSSSAPSWIHTSVFVAVAREMWGLLEKGRSKCSLKKSQANVR